MEKFKLNNPDYFKLYYKTNREKLNTYHNEWVKTNKQYVRKYQKKYYIEKRLKEQNEKIKAFKETLKSEEG